MAFIVPSFDFGDIWDEILAEVTSIVQEIMDVLVLEISSLVELGLGALGGAGLDLNLFIDALFGDGENFLLTVFDEGGEMIEDLLDDIADDFDGLASGYVSDIEGLLTSSYNVLDLVIPEVITQVSTSLGEAFDGLGNIFDEITSEIAVIIEPLTEEFSFMNLSLQSLGIDLISSFGSIFDIDADKLASTVIDLNKKMLEIRAEELLH